MINIKKDDSAIILLSGGLDSLVALDIISKKIDNKNILALFFNYGQKAYFDEFDAVKKISEKYDIKYEKIDLPYLKNITNNALTNPDNNDFDNLESIWVPNRNGLFLNIAASYCDSKKIDYIIIGINEEEGREFSDNTKEYIKSANEFLKYCVSYPTKVIAPCQNMDKLEMVNYMIENEIPFNLIKSCYESKENTGKKHCMNCKSCKLLYNAIIKSKNPKLVKELI